MSNWAPNSQVNIFINKMTVSRTDGWMLMTETSLPEPRSLLLLRQSWGDILATLTITKIATDENGDGDVRAQRERDYRLHISARVQPTKLCILELTTSLCLVSYRWSSPSHGDSTNQATTTSRCEREAKSRVMLSC